MGSESLPPTAVGGALDSAQQPVQRHRGAEIENRLRAVADLFAEPEEQLSDVQGRTIGDATAAARTGRYVDSGRAKLSWCPSGSAMWK